MYRYIPRSLVFSPSCTHSLTCGLLARDLISSLSFPPSLSLSLPLSLSLSPPPLPPLPPPSLPCSLSTLYSPLCRRAMLPRVSSAGERAHRGGARLVFCPKRSSSAVHEKADLLDW